MSVPCCIGSDSDLLFVRGHEEFRYERALWDLIRLYSGRDFPELHLSFPALFFPYILPYSLFFTLMARMCIWSSLGYTPASVWISLLYTSAPVNGALAWRTGACCSYCISSWALYQGSIMGKGLQICWSFIRDNCSCLFLLLPLHAAW